MSIDRLAQLKAMHLYGMAAAWAEHQAEAPSRPAMPEVMLDKLIEAEQADRQARSLRYQLGAARFPVHRDLAGFDWAETPLQQAHIKQLASAAFMAQARNLGYDNDSFIFGPQSPTPRPAWVGSLAATQIWATQGYHCFP